jgi:guanine nucleotide-binding protein subunit gamma
LIERRDRFSPEPSTHETSSLTTMPSGYSSRDVGDPSQVKKNKQSMADLKLRRLTELNNRLREDLERERIPVSQAAKRYIQFRP